MKSFFDRKARLAFGLAILTLVLLGALSYRWVVISAENALRVRHNHEVLESIQDLNLATERIESTSHGFALTGKETDLKNYTTSMLAVEQDQAALRTLTEDNPAQQAHFSPIQALTAVIDPARRYGHRSAPEPGHGGRGVGC